MVRGQSIIAHGPRSVNILRGSRRADARRKRTDERLRTKDQSRREHWSFVLGPWSLVLSLSSSNLSPSQETKVIADQHRIRSRLEELKLSRDGYRRQLSGLTLSPERRERLEVEVRLL